MPAPGFVPAAPAAPMVPAAPAAPVVPAAPAAPAAAADQWSKTVVEPIVPKANPAPRPRFDRGREFYEPIDETHGGAAVSPAGSPGGERTMVERAAAQAPDDATVIVRSGRPGVEGPLAYLIERSGVRAGKVHLLHRDTAVGRASENDIVLSDESVSKRHARIRLDGGKFVFWDLASTNYSRLVTPDGNRSRILEPHPLDDGDTIELGDARVTFVLIAGEGSGDES